MADDSRFYEPSSMSKAVMDEAAIAAAANEIMEVKAHHAASLEKIRFTVTVRAARGTLTEAQVAESTQEISSLIEAYFAWMYPAELYGEVPPSRHLDDAAETVREIIDRVRQTL